MVRLYYLYTINLHSIYIIMSDSTEIQELQLHWNGCPFALSVRRTMCCYSCNSLTKVSNIQEKIIDKFKNVDILMLNAEPQSAQFNAYNRAQLDAQAGFYAAVANAVNNMAAYDIALIERAIESVTA